ncbi:hypothetical protein FFWV33_13055 [Flavobacterium faecale]|uniref:histidine kinase n=1 Tax=Flavobacterium faecale TaxID=1355330 RepID=A0A2S1LF51_9FLAO|nr:hypothetical protein [Flavobacterium faecale]AWG22385.1 hypothetical protein FFWV33_13055 [Flavobacterium faecale]
MNLWLRYMTTVRATILNPLSTNKDLKYWQNDMFANTIIYILPMSLIALIPSFIWALKSQMYPLCTVDVAAVLFTCVIAFKEGINIEVRKILFITIAYTVSTFLVYYAGLNSTLFLLATCCVSLFIFTFKNQYTPAYINIAVSVLYIIISTYDIIPKPAIQFDTTILFAVFSNLIFLSLLIAALVPRIFKGLQDSFDKTLEHALEIEKQNKLLRDISWTQSHVIRAPLSRLMGITYLLKEIDLTEEEKMFYIDNIIVSSNELDGLIQDIVTQSESIRSTTIKENEV